MAAGSSDGVTTLTKEAAGHVEQPESSQATPDGNRARRVPPQLWVASTFAAAVAVGALFYWPGQIDPDSLDEIREASTGHFFDFHTPLLSALWRGPYLLGLRSPGWVLVVTLFTMLCGFYLIARARFGRAAATLIALACLAWPPVLSWAVHIGRDTWFIALFMVSFGFAVRLARMGTVQRRFNVAACIVTAVLSSFAWQIALVPLLVLFGLVAYTLLPRSLSRRRLSACAMALLAVVGLYGLQQGLEDALGTKHGSVQQGTYIYDLAQLSKSEHKLLFPNDMLVHRHGTLHQLERTVQLGTFDSLVFGKDRLVKFQITPTQETSLSHAWLDAVEHDPGAYLSERVELGMAELAITHPSFWTYQVPQDPPEFRPITGTLQHDGVEYLAQFAVGGNLYGDGLYTVWLYLAVALAAVPILLWRGRRQDVMAAGFAASVVLLALVATFTIPELVYRYFYGVLVGGIAVLPLLVPLRNGGAAHRRQRPDRGDVREVARPAGDQAPVLQSP